MYETMLAHASCLVLVLDLVGPTVAHGILRVRETMLELLFCLALALPGFTMALGIPRPGLAALLVSSIILMDFMVTFFNCSMAAVRAAS